MVTRIRTVSVHRLISQRHRFPENPRTFRRQADRRRPASVLPDLHVLVIVLPHFLLPVANRL